MHLRAFFVCIAIAILTALPARAGDIRTREDKTYHGDIKFMDSGKVVVVDDGKTTSLDVSDIAQMMVGDPAKLGGHGLEGQYFQNQDFTDPKGQRIDPVINVRWAGGEKVIEGITSDSYSIRWTGQIRPLYSEQYTFSTFNDDDVRLWINGQQVLESWTGAVGTASGQIPLQAGVRYDIKIDYVNRRSAGVLQLSWTSPSQPQEIVPAKCLYAPMGAGPNVGTGLMARYIPLATGAIPAADDVPAMPRSVRWARRNGGGGGGGGRWASRTDPTINFTWHGPPDGSLGAADHFRALWSGSLNPTYNGSYTFYTHTTGGVKLFVNDTQLVDDWKPTAPPDHTGTIALVAGKRVNIRMEYFNVNGTDPATAILQWSSDKQKQEVVPTKCLFPDTILTGAALQESDLFDVELPPPGQGTVLGDGSIIQAVPAELDPHGTVALHWGNKDLSLPAQDIAIVFQDRAVATTGWAWPLETDSSGGVVLRNGDLLEGGVFSYKDGQMEVSSIIFGLKKYQLSDLQAVLLRKPDISAATFAVHCNDGTEYMAKTLTVKDSSIVIDTAMLGTITLPMTEIFSIKSTK